MRTVYNQASTSLIVDGNPIYDLFEGTSITYTWDGGEVAKTQGTDGAGINIATNQGSTMQCVYRSSRSARHWR